MHAPSSRQTGCFQRAGVVQGQLSHLRASPAAWPAPRWAPVGPNTVASGNGVFVARSAQVGYVSRLCGRATCLDPQ